MMTHPLLDTLEQKVRIMVTEQATLQLEINLLTKEIQRLQAEQKVWQKQISSPLDPALDSQHYNKQQDFSASVPLAYQPSPNKQAPN